MSKIPYELVCQRDDLVNGYHATGDAFTGFIDGFDACYKIMQVEIDRLIESLAYCFPRTSHGIDHGCSDCVGITEYSDGVFVCPYHKAKRALEGEK